jgi:hypothetical protein
MRLSFLILLYTYFTSSLIVRSIGEAVGDVDGFLEQVLLRYLFIGLDFELAIFRMLN